MDMMRCSKAIDELQEIAVCCEKKLLNEENTKASLILPFLGILGYRLILDIEPEYTICSGRVDYFIENKKQSRKSILVECKRLVSTLETDDNIQQLERYTRELEPTVSILTNGKYYNFYRLRNRQLELVFSFNIFKYSLRDLRRLLNFSKETIAFIESLDESFGRQTDEMLESMDIDIAGIIKAEIHTRVLEELRLNVKSHKLYNGYDIFTKISTILGEQSKGLEVEIPKDNVSIPKGLIEELTIYDIIQHMYIHDDIEFSSKRFEFSIIYSKASASILKGSVLSSKCTYAGNKELEEKLEGKVSNYKVIRDIDGILLSDAINIIFGVRNGRIPDRLDDIIRKDIYNNLEDKYIFQSINMIVTLENNMKAVLETIKQLG